MRTAVLILLATTLGYATLDRGAVWPATWNRCLLSIGVALAISYARPVRSRGLPKPALILLCSILALALLQVVVLPEALIGLLSPQRLAFIRQTDQITGVPPMSLSMTPSATVEVISWMIGLAGVYIAIFRVCRKSPGRLWAAGTPIAAAGALQAALGILQMSMEDAPEGATGTYANRNHFAGFLEMALPFAVFHALAVYQKSRSRFEAPAGPAIIASVLLIAGAAVLTGILLSLSRMGFIATLASAFLAGVLYLSRGGARGWVPVALSGAIVAAAFFLLPSGKLVQRFADLASTSEITAEGRAQIWRESLGIVRDFPVTGCGLGAFESCYYRYKKFVPLLTVDYAHNDYVQILAEFGILGFALVLAFGLRLWVIAIRAASRAQDDQVRCLAIACTASLTAILLHSFADFNLYVPANAMLVAWVAGIVENLRDA